MRRIMAFPRTLCVLAGIVAGLGAALWLNGFMPSVGRAAESSSASAIIQGLAVVAAAAVVMFATAAGALVTSDWQADVQSRQAWAQLGLTPAELREPVDPRTACETDVRYLPTADDAALRQVFRAHRLAPPEGPHNTHTAAACAALASARIAHDNGRNASESFAAVTSDRALGKLVATRFAGASQRVPSRRSKLHMKRAAARPRLVANSNAWAGWLARDAWLPTRTSASHTADGIVLSSSHDERAQPLPDAQIAPNGSESTAPPSCRGPPQVVARLPRANPLPATDPIVRDDLGQPIPVCAAELEVIETYLGHLLQDLLASSTDDSGSEQA